MPAELVPAIWNGPFDAETPKGLVRRGDQLEVTDADLLSTHWQAVTAATPPAATPFAKITKTDIEGDS